MFIFYTIFPAYKGKPLSNMAMSSLMKREGYNARPHGFRARFRTWAGKCSDAPFEVKEAVLGHAVDAAVVEAYQHSDRIEAREALMQKWGGYCAAKPKWPNCGEKMMLTGGEMSKSPEMNVIVVGLGNQSLDDHIPAIIDSNILKLVGVCDIDENAVESASERYGVVGCSSIDGLFEKLNQEVSFAVVAIPHNGYLEAIEKLARRGVHIVKEKPFATSFNEAVAISKLVKKYGIHLYLTLQRRHNPVFTSFAQLVKRIGKLYAIEARYVMNIKRLDEGWRASQLFAGGGALIDLGYHYIDLIVWYFGLPDTINCQLSTGNREGQDYDVEDSAFVQFDYNQNDKNENHILGSLVVSRVYPRKDEGMTAFGSRGHVEVRRGMVSRVYTTGEEGEPQEERLERTGSWPSALTDQLEWCAERIADGTGRGEIDRHFLEHIAFIEAAYRSSDQRRPVQPADILNELLEATR